MGLDVMSAGDTGKNSGQAKCLESLEPPTRIELVTYGLRKLSAPCDDPVKQGAESTDVSSCHIWEPWALKRARVSLRGAVSRCHNPRDDAYKDYGQRGIRVHPGWRGRGRMGPNRLLEHIGPPPSPRHTLGRIDNDRGYVPGNVRWETWTQQQNNRRSNVRVTVDGVTRTLAEWAAHTGISRQQINGRRRDGWAMEVAVTTPAGVRKGAAHEAAGMESEGPSRRTA